VALFKTTAGLEEVEDTFPETERVPDMLLGSPTDESVLIIWFGFRLAILS
jgi:hypothetical protein